MQALDNHPSCPPAYGRNSWLLRELSHRKIDVTLETIRKWLAGETMPRRPKMAAITRILRVDETWLAMGTQPIGGVPNDRVAALEAALREIEATTSNEQIRTIISRAMAAN